MAATMNTATFMGKNLLDNDKSIKNSTDLTLKKMFDISEKLVSEQEEIHNLDKIYWKNHSWKQLSLIGDETVINLQRTKVHQHREFADSGCSSFSVQRLHCPGVISKREGHGKLSIHFTADYPTIETFAYCFCQSAQSLRSSCKHV